MNCKPEQEVTRNECKICHGAETVDDPFRRPCKCRGSMSFIHKSCLNECVKISQECGICGHKFSYVKIYRDNMPSYLPLMWIMKAMCDSLLETLYFGACVGYLFVRLYAVITVNHSVILRCILDSEDYGPVLPIFLALFLTLINFFHRTTFTAVSKMLNGAARIRINPRQALQDLASDVILHTESGANTANRGDSRMASSIHSSVAELENSLVDGDEDIDEASSTVSISISYDVSTLFKNTFKLPTNLPRFKIDLEAVFSLTWCSYLILAWYLFLDKCYEGFIAIDCSRIISFMGLSEWQRSSGSPYPTLNLVYSSIRSVMLDCSLLKPLFIMHSSILFTVISCVLLGFLTRRIRSPLLTTAYHCVRLVLTYTIDIYYIYFLIGMFTHVAIASMVNCGVPIYHGNCPLFSFFIHMIVGVIVNRFARTFGRNIFFSFRPGLLPNFHPLGYCHPFNTIRLIIESNLASIIVKDCENLVCTCGIAFIAIYVYSIFSPPIFINGLRTKYVSIKLMALFYVLSEELGNFMSHICLYIILIFSQLFGAMSYVFNRHVPILDRNMLVWDANVNTEVPMLKNKAREVNSRLAKYRMRNSDAQSDLMTEDVLDDLQSSEHTMSSRIDLDSQLSLKELREHRRMDGEERRFLRKYFVNDRKIEKYYCKKHRGKFSLFYYPKHFKLFVFLTSLVCIAAIIGFWYLFFIVSNYLTVLVMPGNSFLFAAIFIGISRFIALIASGKRPSVSAVLKHLTLIVFSNLIWPATAATIYVYFYYDSSTIIRVSDLFLIFWAFSFVPHQYVVKILARNFSVERRCYLLLRKLISCTVLKAFTICCVLVCKRYLGLTFLFWSTVTGFFAYYAVVFISDLVSGVWFDKIRDKYFLKEVAVADYSF